MKRAVTAVSLICALGALGALGAPSTADAAPAGPPADAQMRTVSVTPELAAKGQAAFAMCVGCHGPEASGTIGLGPRLDSASFLAAASDRMLIETIAKGRAGTTMVPWAGALKPDQIEGIVAWLRTRNPAQPATLDERPVKGDAAAGAGLFRDICAKCHGPKGGGYQAAGSGTGIGRAAFLSAVTDGYLRHLMEHGKSQTAMRPFSLRSPVAVANLTPREIEDVIAHLRANAW